MCCLLLVIPPPLSLLSLWHTLARASSPQPERAQRRLSAGVSLRVPPLHGRGYERAGVPSRCAACGRVCAPCPLLPSLTRVAPESQAGSQAEHEDDAERRGETGRQRGSRTKRNRRTAVTCLPSSVSFSLSPGGLLPSLSETSAGRHRSEAHPRRRAPSPSSPPRVVRINLTQMPCRFSPTICS